MKQKLIPLLLCLVLLTGGVTRAADTGAKTEETFTENGIEYRMYHGEAWATVPKDRTGHVTIPAEVRGCPVTKLWRCNGDITSITLPDSMQTIGDIAFSSNSSLQRVYGGKNVWRIGDEAFAYCTSLRELSLPDSVAYIGNYAFAFCSNLKRIDLGNSVQSLGQYAFVYCTALEAISLPDSVVVVEHSVFKNCTSLRRVRLPHGLKELPDRAFENCASLREVSLPPSLSTVGILTFGRCASLRDISFPNSVQQIGYGNLYGSLWMDAQSGPFVCIGSGILLQYKGKETNVQIPDGIHTIAKNAFRDHPTVRRIIVPDSVSTIEDSAFRGAGHLESIRIPEGCTYDKKAFEETPYYYMTYENAIYDGGAIYNADRAQLVRFPRFATTFSVPEGVQSINGKAWEFTESLKSVTLPASLKSFSIHNYSPHPLPKIHLSPENPVYQNIDGAIFERDGQKLCFVPPALDAVTYAVPEETSTVRSYAFWGCTNIKTILLPDHPVELEINSFDSGSDYKFTVHIPASTVLSNYINIEDTTIVTTSGSTAASAAQRYKTTYVLTDRQNAVFTYFRDLFYYHPYIPVCTVFGKDYVSLPSLSALLADTNEAIGFSWQTANSVALYKTDRHVQKYVDEPQVPPEGLPVTDSTAFIRDGGQNIPIDACLVDGVPFVDQKALFSWLGLTTVENGSTRMPFVPAV